MEQQPSSNNWWRSSTGFILIAFLAIAAFFLVTEHRAHLFGILPFVLLLLCPFAFVSRRSRWTERRKGRTQTLIGECIARPREEV